MKRFFSFVVAVIIASTICLPVVAVDGCDCGTTPFIVVSGMAVLPLSASDEQGDTARVYPPAMDKILKAVGEVIMPAAGLVVNKDWNAFADKAFPALFSLIAPLACNKDGDSIAALTYPIFENSMENYDFYTLDGKDEQAVLHAGVDAFGAENVFFFNYDWRLDPLNHADALNAFVESVKKQTGHDKVTLAPCSMGGTVVLSYLEKYGSDDIQNCILLSTAFQGTSVVGELFKREILVDKDALKLRVNQLGRKGFAKIAYPFLMDALDDMGLFDLIIPVIDDLIENLSDRIYNELLEPTFGNMPGIWALVADKDFESAKESMLDKNLNKTLVERIDYYHYNIQQKSKEILQEAMNNGCYVSIVSQYNMQGLPVTVSYKNNNDFLIDTTYSSGGAICADLDKTFGDNYVQKNTACTHNHVSADNVIDASTCMFPEQTWFIKDMAHIDFTYGTQAADFVIWLAGAKKQYDVHSNADYPQFMSFSYETGKLIPLETAKIMTPNKTVEVNDESMKPDEQIGAASAGVDTEECITEKIETFDTRKNDDINEENLLSHNPKTGSVTYIVPISVLLAALAAASLAFQKKRKSGDKA